MKKVTSRVSSILPTSLSKWFGEGRSRQVVRRRDETEDDETAATDSVSTDGYNSTQPPRKRPRNAPPETPFVSNCFQMTSTPIVNNYVQPGPSGYVRQDLVNEVHRQETEVQMNGDDRSDSGESTSGYSSVPVHNAQKESSLTSEKEAGTPKMLHGKCEYRDWSLIIYSGQVVTEECFVGFVWFFVFFFNIHKAEYAEKV